MGLKNIKNLKSKQIVIIALVVLIAAAAYIQYGYNPVGISGTDDVNAINSVLSTPGNNGTNKIGEAVAVSKETNDYFAQAKIDKEATRSKNIDAIKEVAQDTGADKDIKTQANNQLLQLTTNSENEMKIEALIKEKGYQDVLVYLGEEGTADIIVKTPSLNASQTAQIYDIVMRYAKISGEKLSVKNMY